MIKQQQDQLRQEYEGKLANLEREREGIGGHKTHLSCRCCKSLCLTTVAIILFTASVFAFFYINFTVLVFISPP